MVHEQRARGRVAEDFRVVFGDGQQDLGDLFDIAAVGGLYRDGDAGDLAAQGPVGDLAGDQLFVGDDDLFVVECDQGGGAEADVRDIAHDVADGHQVADPDRALDQQDQTADEVGENLLQAEAEADAHRRNQPAQLTEVDAQDAESDDDPDSEERVAADGDQGVAFAAVEFHVWEDQQLEQGLELTQQPQQQHHHHHEVEHIEQGDEFAAAVIGDHGVQLEALQGQGVAVGRGPGRDDEQHAAEGQQGTQTFFHLSFQALWIGFGVGGWCVRGGMQALPHEAVHGRDHNPVDRQHRRDDDQGGDGRQ